MTVALRANMFSQFPPKFFLTPHAAEDCGTEDISTVDFDFIFASQRGYP